MPPHSCGASASNTPACSSACWDRILPGPGLWILWEMQLFSPGWKELNTFEILALKQLSYFIFYVSVCHVCVLSEAGRRELESPALKLQVVMSCLLRVLGSKLKTLGRAASSLNYWVTSTATRTFIYRQVHSLMCSNQKSSAPDPPLQMEPSVSPVLGKHCATDPHFSSFL